MANWYPSRDSSRLLDVPDPPPWSARTPRLNFQTRLRLVARALKERCSSDPWHQSRAKERGNEYWLSLASGMVNAGDVDYPRVYLAP